MNNFLIDLSEKTKNSDVFKSVPNSTDNWQFSVRLLHARLVPACLIVTALDLFIGAASGTLTLMTLGKWTWAAQRASARLDAVRYVLPVIHLHICGFLKPGAIEESEEKQADKSSYKITLEGNGLISDRVIKLLNLQGKRLTESGNLFKERVGSRLTYLALAVCCLVARLADAAFSVPIAAISIITCGRFHFFNVAAFRTLQAPALINDLFYCAVKVLNPWAEVEIE
jgi:hypothetical protein